jgi:phenylalanyl-tRNA synthetase beta chain
MLTTLDGVKRTLDPDMLVIADAERAQALAGVMGGAHSEVSGRTTTVALESAYFQPATVRRAARRLGMSTEASYRFERGANIQGPVAALARVGALLAQLGAGTLRPGVIDVYPAPRLPLRVLLRHDRIARLLGMTVDAVDVERILSRLGFGLERLDAPALTWQATVPFWRVDVAREADLVEEVARHVGYEQLPATFPPVVKAPARPDARLERERVARRAALAAGFSEAVTFTFIERAAALRYVDEAALVPLANPLSEKYAVMRPSLLPGLVESLAHNRRHGRRDVQLFELGAAVRADAGEIRTIALAWTGAGLPEHWSHAGRPVDFFDIKGVVEAVAAALGVPLIFEAATHVALEPGRTASIAAARADGPAHPAGTVGLLRPGVADAHGLPTQDEVYVAELDLDALAPSIDLGEDVRVTALPRYPPVVRDVSLLLPATTPAVRVRDTIRQAAPPELQHLQEFARYEGKGVPDGEVSLSFRLVFRSPDRTLTDAEVQQAVDALLAAVAAAHGARLR